MPEAAFLTIWVLAHENGACVHQILKSLLPMTLHSVRVVVSDNSDRTDSVEVVCRDIAARFEGRLSYVKNVVNLGAIGNILRAFEVCATPYLWIVGACNQFVNGSVDVVVSALQDRRPNCLMIYENNLWRKNLVNESRLYTEFRSLLEDHSYSVLCSINSMIYSTLAFRKYLGCGYEAGSSLVPHTAMILEGLRCHDIDVIYIPVHAIFRPARQRQWSTRKFVRHLAAVFPGHVPEPEQALFLATITRTDQWLISELKRLQEDSNYGYSHNPSQ